MLTVLLTLLAQPTDPVPFPDITFQDMSGKPVQIQQFAGKKVILFNWASW